ncbi:AraC family transcriptional regulator [Bartonella sp. LJL80]
MDPLSDIVSRLKISSQKVVTFDMSSSTRALFPAYSGMKIYIVKNGSFYIKMAGDETVHQVERGDVLILSSGREFSIFDAPNAPAVDVRQIHFEKEKSSYFTNGGNSFSFVGCRFVFRINDTFRYISNLPEPIIIKTQRKENEGIADFLCRLSLEIEKPGPGGELIVEHLLQIILTQALRVLLSSGALHHGEGWFYAMADKNIGLALTSIHDQPGKKWSLDELAKIAGMSRTGFTTKFRKLAGYSVNEYMRGWRFNLAIERMIGNNEKISQIAFDLGYESESSFSTAFKKAMGVSPKTYIMKNRQ